MLKSYLKIALRSLLRNPTFSLINLSGLALGLACSLLIFLWVQDERSMDAFHVHKDHLYNLIQRTQAGHKVGIGYETPGLLAPEIKKDLPEVQYAATYSGWGDHGTFRVSLPQTSPLRNAPAHADGNQSTGDKTLKEQGEFASEDFFKLFSYPLLQGNAATALNTPLSIALSRKMAASLFGSPEKAYGKTVRYEDRQDFTVTAVFEDLPIHSSWQFDYLINYDWLIHKYPDINDWNNVAPYTTVLLRADADPEQFRDRIRHFLDNLNTKQSADYKVELNMQRYDEMYLHGGFVNRQIGGGRIEYVNLFSIVAAFILLIACINFVNLTTARSVKRAKEIGIRKTAGALRGVLMGQFIGEAVLLAAIAVLIALALMMGALPFFNRLTGKEILLPLGSAVFWWQLAGLTLLTGFLSGLYPALVLSSFHPITVLKGSMRFGTGNTLFRKGLVVFQFTLSMLLITGTILVSQQLDYIRNAHLGFDREQLVYLPLEGNLVNSYALFRERALQLPGIQEVTAAAQPPMSEDTYWTNELNWEGKDPHDKEAFVLYSSGYGLVKTMGLELLQGRDFSPGYATDTTGYLLNEAAVRQMHYKDPVGKFFTLQGHRGPILGVIKDFHFNSLHDAIWPLVINYSRPQDGGDLLIRTQPGKTRQAITGLAALCRDLNPAFPFTCTFSDEEYQKLYKSEAMIRDLSIDFAILAIFISCLGLLGLVIFTAEQRIKEIGIRKVLGAGIGSIFGLLSREFMSLVGVSVVIATPLAWWAVHEWLKDYAYHIPIQWTVFVWAGMLVIFIALMTISYQSVRAALVNPVRSLRSE